LEQRDVVAEPALDRAVIEEVGVVVTVENETGIRFDDVQEEVKVDEPLGA
jgi:hypothetical protein